MSNPFRGVLLEGRYYNYSQYRFTQPLQNSATETQTSRTFSAQGKSFKSHSVTLELENSYEVYFGTSLIGTTTWLGISRYDDLVGFIGAQGVSMPIAFVDIAGSSHTVVPVGDITIEPLRLVAQDEGVEWRVTLTLDNTS
jgi:hypothetical protein